MELCCEGVVKGEQGIEWLTEEAVTNSEKYFKMASVAVIQALQTTL